MAAISGVVRATACCVVSECNVSKQEEMGCAQDTAREPEGEKSFRGSSQAQTTTTHSQLNAYSQLLTPSGYHERLCPEWSALSPEVFAARKGAGRDGITSITVFGFVGGVISKRFVCLPHDIHTWKEILEKKKYHSNKRQ